MRRVDVGGVRQAGPVTATFPLPDDPGAPVRPAERGPLPARALETSAEHPWPVRLLARKIEQYVERIDAEDWHQHVLSLYLVGGLFDDFFASLAGGLRDGYRNEAIAILRDDTGRAELKELLQAALEAEEGLSSWLALWGRRLVGDTLLVSRAVLALSEGRPFVASEVEPVFTELIADHIRRMDGLGLTA